MFKARFVFIILYLHLGKQGACCCEVRGEAHSSFPFDSCFVASQYALDAASGVGETYGM
jgi:hypothetical protein